MSVPFPGAASATTRPLDIAVARAVACNFVDMWAVALLRQISAVRTLDDLGEIKRRTLDRMPDLLEERVMQGIGFDANPAPGLPTDFHARIANALGITPKALEPLLLRLHDARVGMVDLGDGQRPDTRFAEDGA